jgi:hypothetical protein
MLTKKTQDLADRMVAKFKAEFNARFNTVPVVTFSRSDLSLNPIELNVLLDLVNETMFATFRGRATEQKCMASDMLGIKGKYRFRHVTTYRHIFIKLARNAGYTHQAIANSINHNHASVYHGEKRITMLLDNKDSIALEAFNNIHKTFANYTNNEAIFNSSDRKQSESKSGILALLRSEPRNSSEY